MNEKNKFFHIKAKNNTEADIYIYGEITKYAFEEYGEVSSITFKNELNALGEEINKINLYINSPGGSVFEGMAIMAMLQRHPAPIHAFIDGVAASCASVIPMIADKITAYENSMFMIHHAWTFTHGNANELRKAADDLERINESMIQFYLKKAGDKLDEAKLKEMLDAETWLSATEAFRYGLCDEVIEANQAVAKLEGKWMNQYKNIPNIFKNQEPVLSKSERKRISDEAKAGFLYIQSKLGGLSYEAK